MAKINLVNGQDIVVLSYAGDYYLNNTAANVGTTFNLHGLPITPIVDECESDGNQTVELGTSQVTDNLGDTYSSLVGGRPRTRVRK